MSITKQVLVCAFGLAVIRMALSLLGTSDNLWLLINQWIALIYFWAMNRWSFEGVTK